MALVQEDFVFTLSDNDDDKNANSNDDEIVPKENSTTVAAQSKKRKRTGENLTEAPDLTKGKKKPSKKAKKHSRKGATKLTIDELPQVDSDEEETPWKGQGEDDGTMNPDFDFQLGNNMGLVEEFDGWGAGRGEERSAQGGDKKGVDIDEIIKRRREKDEVDQANTPGKDTISLGDDVEPDEEAPDEDRPDDADEDGDEVEDELLAEDAFGMGAIASAENVDGDATDSPDGDSSVEGSSDDESIAAPVAHPGDVIEDGVSEDEDEVDAAEIARQEAFFAPNPEESSRSKKSSAATVSRSSFQDMSLSRPVLKGLATLNFSQPTPIQAKTIPLALLGRDLVGGAVTGSGKTAAFLVPILERLLYRPKKVPTSRVAILMPTRELAVQCHAVATKLSAFTDVSFVRLVGGYSLREQEAELRLRPDVIIATPGRFIDHMRNSASFTVDTLEILVLDEADRMLEDGFADELNEILTTIPKSRQTMLFSATMTSSVDQLIRVGMTRPVRVLVDARRQTVGTLVQEFVRLRPGREEKRLAYLMLLCQNVYTERVIVFFRQKTEAHRVRVIFGLCGIKAAELHGSMSQDQRISAVESFRSGASTHLLATDLASRGLDIKKVSTVINYEAPQSHSIYLHRVGRTARAGRSGRACTLAAESDRKVVRAAVRGARAQTPAATVVSRVMDSTAVDAMEGRLRDLAEAVDAVLDEEREERALLGVERDLRKGENFLRFGDEIQARPRRTWFESEKEKKRVEGLGRVALNGEKKGLGKLEGGGKLSGKDKKRLDIRDLRGELGGGWKKGKAGGAGLATAAGAAGKKDKARVGKPVAKGKAKVKVKGKGMGSKSKSAPKRKAKTGSKLRR